MSIISFGGVNKSLLYITLEGVFKVLNQYTYGFIYIECFYQMNIYRILYNAIIDPKKKIFLIIEYLIHFLVILVLLFYLFAFFKKMIKMNKNIGKNLNLN